MATCSLKRSLSNVGRSHGASVTVLSRHVDLEQAITETVNAAHLALESLQNVQLAYVSVSGDYDNSHLAGTMLRAKLDSSVTVLGSIVNATGSLQQRKNNTNNATSPALAVTLVQHPDLEIFPFRFSKELRDQPRVGRYNIAGRIEPAMDFSKFQSVSTAPALSIPENLAKLNPASDPTFLVAGDDHCEPFLKALDTRFPSSTKAGIVGQQTPFINGRPYTFFLNNDVVEDGFIGVALVGPVRSRVKVAHNGRFLGKPLQITKARGNIILEIDGRNPSQMLLDLASFGGARIDKEDQFFLAVSQQQVHGEIPKMHQEDFTILRVVSGDPKRGPIAVETIRDLNPGLVVQFVQANRHAKESLPSTVGNAVGEGANPFARLHFHTLQSSNVALDSESNNPLPNLNSSPLISHGGDVYNAVYSSSEGGCIASANSFTSIHRLPDTIVTLSLSSKKRSA